MPFKDPEKRKAYQREYVKTRWAEDQAYRDRGNSYQQTDEAKAKAKVYNALPEVVAKRKVHASSDRKKAIERRRLYGITVADQDALFELQEGRCAICLVPLQQYEKRCQLDHDHATGLVRGYLCTGCNTSLACVEEHLSAIQAYLGARKKKGP